MLVFAFLTHSFNCHFVYSFHSGHCFVFCALTVLCTSVVNYVCQAFDIVLYHFNQSKVF